VKRSYDGENWESFAMLAGSGTSSIQKNYAVRDDAFKSNGIIYYQVTQFDFNGDHEAFPVQATNAFCKNHNEPIIFPNPTKDFVNIKSNLDGKLKLFDATGRIITVSDINTVSNTLDLTPYANGMYTIQIILGQEEYNYKIIKN